MTYGPGSAREVLSGARAVTGAGFLQDKHSLGPQTTVAGICPVVSACSLGPHPGTHRQMPSVSCLLPGYLAPSLRASGVNSGSASMCPCFELSVYLSSTLDISLCMSVSISDLALISPYALISLSLCLFVALISFLLDLANNI